MYRSMQKLSNPMISAKTNSPAYPTLQKALDYVQKIEREIMLAEGIQQTECDTVMSRDVAAGNDLMIWQMLENVTCFKCRQKDHYRKDYRKDYPNSVGTHPALDQDIPVQSYSPPMAVIPDSDSCLHSTSVSSSDHY